MAFYYLITKKLKLTKTLILNILEYLELLERELNFADR